jgi:hypothetical protein
VKPKLKTIKYYDWLEIENYLQEKTGRNFRDWAGKWDKEKNDDIPYQDFWHWMLDNYEITNGMIIDFTTDWDLEQPSESWVKEILTLIKDEFGPLFKVMVRW